MPDPSPSQEGLLIHNVPDASLPLAGRAAPKVLRTYLYTSMDSWAVLPAEGFEVKGKKADTVVRFTCAAGEAVCAAMTRMRDGEEVGGPA